MALPYIFLEVRALPEPPGTDPRCAPGPLQRDDADAPEPGEAGGSPPVPSGPGSPTGDPPASTRSGRCCACKKASPGPLQWRRQRPTARRIQGGEEEPSPKNRHCPMNEPPDLRGRSLAAPPSPKELGSHAPPGPPEAGGENPAPTRLMEKSKSESAPGDPGMRRAIPVPASLRLLSAPLLPLLEEGVSPTSSLGWGRTLPRYPSSHPFSKLLLPSCGSRKGARASTGFSVACLTSHGSSTAFPPCPTSRRSQFRGPPESTSR